MSMKVIVPILSIDFVHPQYGAVFDAKKLNDHRRSITLALINL